MPNHRGCGKRNSVDHSLDRHLGHNNIRDAGARIMQEVKFNCDVELKRGLSSVSKNVELDQ